MNRWLLIAAAVLTAGILVHKVAFVRKIVVPQ